MGPNLLNMVVDRWCLVRFWSGILVCSNSLYDRRNHKHYLEFSTWFFSLWCALFKIHPITPGSNNIFEHNSTSRIGENRKALLTCTDSTRWCNQFGRQMALIFSLVIKDMLTKCRKNKQSVLNSKIYLTNNKFPHRNAQQRF